jgi:hypothetical protein
VDLRKGYIIYSAVKRGAELDASAELQTNVWTDWKMSSHDDGLVVLRHIRLFLSGPYWRLTTA